MFIDRLINDRSTPLLEQVVNFAAARHRLIAENIANVDTPGYRQKDLSVAKFQAMLRRQIDCQGSGRGGYRDVSRQIEHPAAGILAHDGNNRSMEHLATDLAKNAMMHNLAIELLRKQYQTLELAIKERVT